MMQISKPSGLRLILLAAAVAIFACALGVTTWIVANGPLGWSGAQLTISVAVAVGVGGILAATFGEPLFSEGLRHLLTPKVNLEEVTSWVDHIRSSALHNRAEGSLSQRTQMLHGAKIMDLTTSGTVEITHGRDDRPHVRSTGPHQPFSRLIEEWRPDEERLVILGDPGYGKTFASLTLLSHINRSTRHLAELFPLVDWHNWRGVAGKPKTIEGWIAFQLIQSYPGLPQAAAMEIASSDELIPIFDGLDEIPAANRPACRDALEAYSGHGKPFRTFVVTCRQDEYLSLRPRWIGADRHHTLLGLDREEIQSMLRASVSQPSRWQPVFAALDNGNKPLLDLLRSPLRLSSVVDIYGSHHDPRDLLALSRDDDAATKLWDLLLGADRHSFPGARPGDVRKWLSFLAASLKSHGRLRFWLHELYLYPSPRESRRFHMTFTVGFTALLVWPWILVDSLVGKLLGVFVGALNAYVYVKRRDAPMGLTVRVRKGVLAYLRMVPRSVLVGLTSGVLWSVFTTPSILAILVLAATLEGASLDLPAALDAASSFGLYTGILLGGIITAFGVGGVGGQLVAEEPPDHLTGRGPGAVLRGTLVHSLLMSGFCTAIVGIPYVLLLDTDPIALLPLLALNAAWLSGLDAWAFYHWSRLSLARAGLLPRKLRRFLDSVAEDTGWLRASDAYEFRHRELLEFLSRETKPIGATNLSWAESVPIRAGFNPEALPEPSWPDFSGVDGDSALGSSVRCATAGDPIAALAHARAAVEASPNSVLCRQNLALRLLCLGHEEEACAVLNAANGSGPLNSDLRQLRRTIEEEIEVKNIWLRKAKRRSQRRRRDPYAQWRLALGYRAFGFAEEADAARGKAIEKRRGNSREGRALAWSLNARGFSNDALRVAAEISPDTHPLTRAAALAHSYRDLGLDKEASAQLERSRETHEEARHLNSFATTLISFGAFDDALEAIQKAIADEPEERTYRFTRAEILLAAGDLKAAGSELADALALARTGLPNFGDPAWLCRIIWSYVDPALMESAVGTVRDAYRAGDAIPFLSWGLTQATPISADQSHRERWLLDDWCAAWAASGLQRGVGIVRALGATYGLPPVGPPATSIAPPN